MAAPSKVQSDKPDIHVASAVVRTPRGPLFKTHDLHIPFGKKILVRGQSGIGKTTFLHLLAGLVTPNEGFVEIGDRRLSTLSTNQLSDLRRSHFGIVFQKLNLLDHLTALENVKLGAGGITNEAASASLERVKLGNRGGDLAAVMSLGEQQRVAVARVLATAPPILLADEPTSSLDDENASAVIRFLLKSAKPQTLIVVSHDARIATLFDEVFDFGKWSQA